MLRIKACPLAPAFHTKHLGAEADLVALFRRKRAGSQRKPEHALWLGEPHPHLLSCELERMAGTQPSRGGGGLMPSNTGRLLLLLCVPQALTALFNSSKEPRNCVQESGAMITFSLL